MAYLTRDDILGADDIERETVEVPEWGGEVLVRGLTAQQYIGMGFDLRDEEGLNTEKAQEMMPKIVSLGVIDENGDCLFTVGDIKTLGRKSFGPIERISTTILRLSGLTTEEVEEKN